MSESGPHIDDHRAVTPERGWLAPRRAAAGLCRRDGQGVVRSGRSARLASGLGVRRRPFRLHGVDESVGDPQRPGPAERTRAGGVQTRETQRGALVRTVGVLQIALFVVAGLDAGRYGWSTVPMPVQVIGWLLLVPAVWLVSWVLMSNTYASVELRIQAERGHLVIATGPYAYVRHPM